MKNQLKKLSVILFAALLFTGFVFIGCGDIFEDGIVVDGSGVKTARAVTISNKDEQGVHDGYNYEIWRDYGNVSMTLENGGNFSCSWSNIGNVLCRKGKKFDSTKTHSQIGNISIMYDAQFTPGGNSYLCVYGWSKDPLVEYYIIESYGTYKPTGTAKGSVTIDGGTYELYETTRTNQPSIEGTKTFKQFWSVRTSKRTSGTISVTEHFKAWEKQGMTLGKLYEVALTAEGYQSNGSAKITNNTLTIGGSGSGSDGSNNGSGSGNGSGSASGVTKVEAENMTKGGKYTGNCSSPFSGVILYANDDKVSFNQYFTNNSHNFKLRGASSNSKEAQVELRIGGNSYGTFKFSGTSAAEKTITATHNKGGNTATVELVCVNDNDTWDVLIDWIEISASGSSSGSNGSGSGGDNSSSSGGSSSGGGNSSGTKIEAENMTKGGQYTGNCNSPFTGVVLYANDDKVSFSQYFTNNSHNFKLRGASSNSKEAQVELRIGGTSYGTFKFSGTSATEKTIAATHNKGGNTTTVELVCVNDNDTWDVLIDWIEISASGDSSGSSGNGSGGGNSSGTKIEAESMTKGGQYTGDCDSPFTGVVLYANNDKVSFSQYFANNSNNFKIRCASSNDKEAQVELRIGGTSYGVFKFSGTSATEKTIVAAHNKGGSTATVELVCVNDNNTWDAKIDWIEISAK